MSVARGFGLNGKSFYTNVAKPMQVNMAWTVTPTNALGVTSLKSNGYVNNVFMHTSTTPGANNGFTNPNPASGYALIQLKQNFNAFLGMTYSFQVPTATDKKIDNSELTAGQVYVITTLGDATAANWAQLGVPKGVTPAIGVAFTALVVGVTGEANTSTTRVQVPGSSAIDVVEVVGSTNTMITSNISSNAGQWVTLQFSKPLVTMASYTPAGTNSAPALTMNSYTPAGVITNGSPDTFAGTPATLTGTVAAPTFTGSAATLTDTVSTVVAAPTTASIISVQIYFDGSSVTIDGL
jgi:hypothetical protein